MDPKVTNHLTQFPTNKQISQLLMLAQKRAEALVEFTGMQKIPGETSDLGVIQSREEG